MLLLARHTHDNAALFPVAPAQPCPWLRGPVQRRQVHARLRLKAEGAWPIPVSRDTHPPQGPDTTYPTFALGTAHAHKDGGPQEAAACVDA